MSANMKDSWWGTTSWGMQTYSEQYETQRKHLEMRRMADIEKQKLMEYFRTVDRKYDRNVYQNVCTLGIRTTQQDQEIATLQDKLKEKEVKKDTDLKSLIAYYYNR